MNGDQQSQLTPQQQQMMQQQAQMQQVQMQQQALAMQLNQVEQEENQFWATFDSSREDARYDCTIDEIQATPTYKLATLETITKLMHQGVQIPQEILMRYLDLEEDVKIEWSGIVEKQKTEAAQGQQQQMQMAAQMKQMEEQVKIAVQELRNQGAMNVELIKAKVKGEQIASHKDENILKGAIELHKDNKGGNND